MVPGSRSKARRGAFAVKALSWLILAGSVLVLYLVVVVGGLALFGGTARARTGLSLIATVLVAVSWEPARRRTQAAVSRLLATPLTEPYEVLSSFTSRLGETASVELMTHRMARVLAEGTAAAWAQVWLLVHDELRLVATWPPGATASASVPSLTGEHRATMHSVPVGHGEEVLGVLRMQEQPGRPMTSVESRLFAGLAGQAGLLLSQAQLRAELQTRVDELDHRASELKAARAELVTASDAERRRLERDLHDGAQQELVALSINLGLARAMLATDPSHAGELVSAQVAAARSGIETLTTISRGLEPALLASEGLDAALRGLAASAPIPTAVKCETGGNLSPDIQAAVYYCASEALQNAVKHSGASLIELRWTINGGTGRLDVIDNGAGMPAQAPSPVPHPQGAAQGTGLRGMHDRAALLGGTVSIDSTVGIGTTVSVRVPLARRGQS